MSRIQLTREINVSRVEGLLDAISTQPNQDVETFEQISGAAFGGEAALIQFFFTWSTQNPDGRLWLKADSHNDQFAHEIDKLAKRAFGFVAILMAADVLDRDQQSCRKLAYRGCESWVDRMFTSGDLVPAEENFDTENDAFTSAINNSLYGHRTFLPCVDHSTKSKIVPFYHSNGEFRKRSEFRRFAETLIGRRSEQFIQNNPEVFEGLGAILYELMHNTHDWARTDIDESPLRKSIRGILFTRLHLPESSIRKAAGDNAAIAEYMFSVAQRHPGDYIDLAELSVIDAGPGLAARWLSHIAAPTVNDEHDACVACLGMHRTTSAEAYRGMGLYDVMRTLDELSAMVRVRTGRIAMLRDFIASPLLEEERKSGPRLPLSPEHDHRPNGLARVAGTVFTILFPLK